MRSLRIFLCAAALIVVTAFACNADAAEIGTVTANSGLRLRNGASSTSGTITTVAKDAEVVITELGETWSQVNYNGTVGYMSTEYLDHSDTAEFTNPILGKVTASVVNVRSGPSTDDDIVGQLANSCHVSILGVENGWYHVTTDVIDGYIHPDYIIPVSATATASSGSGSAAAVTVDTSYVAAANANLADVRSSLIGFAKQFIGTRYTYGGRSPSSGFDCSGFVYYVFKNFGYTLNPGASTQMSSVKVISRSELVAGDLVFFNDGSARRASHVGIYIGGGQFIHAVSPGNPLTISDLSSSYYANNFVGGGRVLPLS